MLSLLRKTLKMEIVLLFGTSVDAHQTADRHILEDGYCNSNGLSHKNIKSHPEKVQMLIYSMEQSPSSEDDSHADCRESACLLWKSTGLLLCSQKPHHPEPE
jgi:hypothetical protein